MGSLRWSGSKAGLLVAMVVIAAGAWASSASAAVTLSGAATPTAPLGSSITDAATLSGLVPAGAGGTLTFTAYGPNDPTCAASVFNNAVDADDNGTYFPSVPFTPASIGTYYWKLVWSGNDTNPGQVVASCNPMNPSQTSLITPAVSPPSSTSSNQPTTPSSRKKKCKKRKRHAVDAKKKCKKK
jgi:hypothetical protein